MTTEYRSAPITEGNLKASRITVTPFRHLLPADVIGSNNKDDPAPAALKLHWRHHLVETDIPRYPHGKGPRGFFRDRAFAKLLLTDSGAEAGDVVIFEKLGSHAFRLHVEKPSGHRIS
ncbi:hypothetical protein PXK58_01975 [Phaeobacter gallaeciensis]|uniref:hypothetical protein n=1 Tax=Phaeobacter gallaeciensis TaxID=60890 RepID=UPI00237FE0DD|nr:hypothetical protein [Phaeobacter gallaeciensis]MDE4272742.1 hypothetical protein [Phaeobacter gallaeciensis]MDE4298305.1 hypothetical protein [Phaeobacter gallaeciensis]MDE5183493.1 hypothetical protein [Phaeobacter gallaeciensis]